MVLQLSSALQEESPPTPQGEREREEKEGWGKEKDKNRQGEQGERDGTKEEHTVIKGGHGLYSDSEFGLLPRL